MSIQPTPPLAEILHPDHTLNRDDLIRLLELRDPAEVQQLLDAAYAVKLRHVGNTVYFRGLIELSNICTKDCFYCGIRRGNRNVRRFTMTMDEVLAAARWAGEAGYGSVVLQAGERRDEAYTAFITEVIREIKKLDEGRLGLTLSLGEQSAETYRRWYEAGAHRYLLRIETSNPQLYSRLHPADHSWQERLQCLLDLREAGYQVGTGVMIGLPGQTSADLADDILFFARHDIDMIGMGPYLVHQDTPLAACLPDFDARKGEQLELGLKMIAVTRLYLKDVNMASTTALQALTPSGREMGLKAGANIIMPNITDVQYRSYYQLYDNKPCLDENAAQCQDCLKRRIEAIGETIGYRQWGDSPHFHRKHPEK